MTKIQAIKMLRDLSPDVYVSLVETKSAVDRWAHSQPVDVFPAEVAVVPVRITLNDLHRFADAREAVKKAEQRADRVRNALEELLKELDV